MLHGAPVVRVPLVDELNAVQMTGILGLTGLSAEEFVRLLVGDAPESASASARDP
jgi:hypothetical protein